MTKKIVASCETALATYPWRPLSDIYTDVNRGQIIIFSQKLVTKRFKAPNSHEKRIQNVTLTSEIVF